MAKPNSDAVDGSGFDDFISKKGKSKAAGEIGVKGSKWPSAEEVADVLKKQGSAPDVSRVPIQFMDPAYFDPLLFFVQHRDRRELNFRLRHAYEYEPVVGNLIDLHRTMPLSNFRLVCRDKSIESEFLSFAEDMEILNLSSYILGDYFLLGEACVYKVWDDYDKRFKEITLLPPEKIELRKTYLSKTPLMLLHVDSDLKRLVNSADPLDKAIVKEMDPALVDQIKTKDRIVLPPHQAVHFANKTSESDLRGTSILKRGLYALLLKYKLRLLHSTYIDRGTFPLKIFKVGHPESKWVPSRAHFDALRNMLSAAANDPDFAIIYHYGLQVEYIGAKDKWENLLPHYDWCDKELMMALFGNEALLQSKGTTFSNANVSVRVLMSRYQMIRSQLELFWKNHIFRQMAEARDYWIPDRTGNTAGLPTKIKNGKTYFLDVPNFKWAKLNLLDDTAQKQFLMRLRERMEVPHKMISEIFDMDPEEVKEQLKNEEGSVVDQSYIEVKKKASILSTVMSQVLEGRKPKEWVLPSENPEDAAKREKAQKADPGTPAGPGAAPAPAAPAAAPAQPAAPRAAPAPGVGTPPEPTATEPGKGVMQPPI